MRQFFPLQLIFIYVFDLFWLDAEVIQRLPLCAMVEADHRRGRSTPKVTRWWYPTIDYSVKDLGYYMNI